MIMVYFVSYGPILSKLGDKAGFALRYAYLLTEVILTDSANASHQVQETQIKPSN